jgi:hypothetical protein
LVLLAKTDRWPKVSVDAFEQLRLPLAASEAVLTELFHLVGGTRREMEAAWRLMQSGAVVLGAIENSELPHTCADVALCGSPDGLHGCNSRLSLREALSTIFTVDHTDFNTSRILGRRQFRVVLATRP